MSRFAKLYATLFSVIWIGYGLYSVYQQTPSSGLILLLGIAFSITIIAATWFSQWILKKYRILDQQRIQHQQKRT